MSTHAAITERLARAGCVAAAEEADELLGARPDAALLEAWVRRREHGEPLAWIVGSMRFAGRVVRVDRGVYVPRIQSEDLARRAAARLPADGWALDLCTGAGAVAAHLQATVATATVIGTDLDPAAARCARANGVPTVVADLAEPIGGTVAFDVVTMVAPYVPTVQLRLLPADVQRYEPRMALDGGPDGLTLVRRVIAAGRRLLRPGGSLLLEVGGDQDDRLAPTFAEHGFASIAPWWDDDGDLRGIEARFDG